MEDSRPSQGQVRVRVSRFGKHRCRSFDVACVAADFAFSKPQSAGATDSATPRAGLGLVGLMGLNGLDLDRLLEFDKEVQLQILAVYNKALENQKPAQPVSVVGFKSAAKTPGTINSKTAELGAWVAAAKSNKGLKVGG